MNIDREQLREISAATKESKDEVAAVWVPIDKVLAWDKNPRKNDHAVKGVMESIKRFGFASPIIARKEDNMVIAGHTRLKAAKRLGLDRVPVRFLDLDPADAKMLAIADNKLGEVAEWDESELADILNDLNMEGLDLSFTGFSDDELNGFLDIDFGEEEEGSDYDGELDFLPEEVVKEFETGDEAEVGMHKIICGDCVEVLRGMPDNSIDSIVCDPPYGIDFMARKWDSSVPQNDWATEAYRVLKPGGHLIAFAATRTVHRLGTVIESANFEIRDMMHWIYASGFPKTMNIGNEMDKLMGTTEQREVIGTQRLTGTAKPANGGKGHAVAKATGAIDNYSRSKQAVTINKTAPASDEAVKWNGWGTALKPACEPAVLARKPLSEKTVAKNILKWGTGALNVDGCRFPFGDECWFGPDNDPYSYPKGMGGGNGNIIITDSEDAAWRKDPFSANDGGRFPANVYHCKKAQKREREEGLEELKKQPSRGAMNTHNGTGERVDGAPTPVRANFHPTVKPIKLMRYLVKLVTPPDGVVLDTFCGSGTTLIAAETEGIQSIGVEREPEYCDIIFARLKYACGE